MISLHIHSIVLYCTWITYQNNMPSTFVWDKVGLVTSRSLVQFPTGALSSVLGQDSLFHIASVHPAAKRVLSINKAVLRACAIYAASCSGISPGD